MDGFIVNRARGIQWCHPFFGRVTVSRGPTTKSGFLAKNAPKVARSGLETRVFIANGHGEFNGAIRFCGRVTVSRGPTTKVVFLAKMPKKFHEVVWKLECL